MAKRLKLKDIIEIRKDLESGLTQQEVADLRGFSRQTINSVAKGRAGQQHQIADRYEYFVGESARKTGNLINGQPEYVYTDEILEELIFIEEQELNGMWEYFSG